MKKWKAVGTLAVVFFCGLAGLTGCIAKDTGKEEETENKKRVTLTFMTFKRETRHIFEQIIEEFNDSQDMVHIEQIVVPNPGEELKIRAVQGRFPDMVEFIGDERDVFEQYVEGGYLSPVTDFSCVDKIYAQFLEKLKVGDEHYLLPLSINYRGLFLNKGKMEEKGYPIPDTYEELIDVMEQIKQDGETAIVFPDEDQWTIHQGWDAIDTVSRGIQEPLFRDAAEGIRSISQDDLAVETTEKFLEIRKYGQPNALSTGYDEAVKFFAAGNAYMFPQGNWAYPLIKRMNPKIDLVFIPFPVNEGKKQEIVVKLDSSIGVSADCKDKEAVETFMEYLFSDEVNNYYSSEAGSYSCAVAPNRPESYDEAFVKRIEEGSFSIEKYAFFSEIDDERNELFRRLVSQPEQYPIKEFLGDLSDMLVIHRRGILMEDSE